MKSQMKTILVTMGIIVGTTVGVTVFYNLYTRWDRNRAYRNRHTKTILAHRGDIRDMGGSVLARTVTVYDIYMDCLVIKDSTYWDNNIHELAPFLAQKFPQRDAEQWQAYLQEGRAKGRCFVSIAKNLTEDEANEIKTFPVFELGPYKGGGIIQSREKRIYPYGELARRTIGFIGTADTVKFGIEWDYNDWLKGTNGKAVVLYGRYEGNDVKKEIDSIHVEHGYDIVTTLDLERQQMADSVLRKAMSANDDIESGCVIVMDVETGALRVMVNLGRDSESGEIHETIADVINRQFEPGSLAKVLPLAAALEDGYIHSLDETIPTNHGLLEGFIRDAHIEDYEHTHGSKSISVIDGFSMSSNYVFAYFANKYYSDSVSSFDDHIKKYCGGTDFNLPEKYQSRRDVLTRSMGYNFTMTPLSVLTLYNTIANKGKKMRPYWVEYLDGEPPVVYGYGPDSLGQAMPAAVADTIMRALKAVTKNGTGKALIDVYPGVAGKTGTSRVAFVKEGRGNDPYHDQNGRTKSAAAYVGIVPVDDPAYSIICVLYSKPSFRTIYGSSAPAYVVRDIVSGMYE